jgi:NADPH2:quinone reductase
MTDYAIRFGEVGGPEVLRLEEISVGPPDQGDLLIRHTAVGLNFIDTYHRSGLYPVPLPSGIGLEAAGVVEAVGEGVTAFKPGDRIGYCQGPIGAYATRRTIPADMVVPLPEGVSDEQAAASMLKGLTAEYLIERCAKVEPGQWVLNHAAAGGVGLIATQWLKAIGAHVIGTVGSAAKAELAKAAGADHVVRYDQGDWAAEVKRLTGGVHAVFDGVGKDTFEGSLSVLRTRGLLASYGNASGPVPPIQPLQLGQGGGGSLFLTRPSLFAYYQTVEERRRGSARLFGLMAEGKITVRVDQRFPLADAAEAHRALEGRHTTGSTVLVV